jgi:outer membrane lipoprotein
MKRLICTTSLIVMTGFLLSACTTILEQLQGDYVALVPQDTTESNLQTPVRWGGVILETRPEKDYTCFEVLARQLGTSMRPRDTDQANGRFIACKPGFYDPEVFEKGREVTLTGKIIHMDVRKVGEYDYQFPVVDIEFMTLWPERIDRVYYDYYGMYSPYYWHYPYYGSYYWRYPYPYIRP